MKRFFSEEIKSEGKRKFLRKTTELENNLHNLAYYKEGYYSVEATKRGKIREKWEKEMTKCIEFKEKYLRNRPNILSSEGLIQKID